MSKRPNTAVDVFKFINMHGGDTTKCWEWTRPIKAKRGKNVKPRPYFDLNGKKVLAYRLVYKLVKGEDALPDDVMLLHHCDNSLCCNPEHAYPGDHDQNMDDMAVRGTHGVSSHAVRAIRKLLAETDENGKKKHTQQQIADLYGISREAVSAIATGRNRARVPDNEDADGRQQEDPNA